MADRSGGQRRTTPDIDPQGRQATRQARDEASWLRDEEVTAFVQLAANDVG